MNTTELKATYIARQVRGRVGNDSLGLTIQSVCEIVMLRLEAALGAYTRSTTCAEDSYAPPPSSSTNRFHVFGRHIPSDPGVK